VGMRFEATKWTGLANSDQELGSGRTAGKVALRSILPHASTNSMVGTAAKPTVAEARLYTTTVKRMLLARWRDSESMQQPYSVKGDPASARKSSGALRPSALPGVCRALAARPAAWIAFAWRV
jgi:hypothetical protein